MMKKTNATGSAISSSRTLAVNITARMETQLTAILPGECRARPRSAHAPRPGECGCKSISISSACSNMASDDKRNDPVEPPLREDQVFEHERAAPVALDHDHGADHAGNERNRHDD